MKVFRNFFLILLSVICILLIPLLLIYESFNTTILKPYESINYLDKSGIYQEAEVVIEEEISKRIELLGIGSLIPSNISNNLVSNSITIEWISYFSKDIQTSFWKYITNETDKINDISLTGFNKYIKEMVSNEISTIPFANTLLENTMNSKLDQLIPQSLSINDYFSDYTKYLEKAKNYYQTMKVFEVVIFLLLAFIIIFIAILSSNLKKAFKNLGIIFSISGVITLIPVLFLNVFDIQTLYTQLQSFEFYQYFSSSIMKLVSLIADDIAMNLSMISVAVLLLGVLLLLVSRVLKVKSDKTKSIRN